ncbi:conserved domain protein [Ruminococcus albus 8]|uniref:Conserved domain protein n=1 Tax=Ruminococcus albus 8 TaxID=246199 RepID=E9SAK8_RUMAL|nr:conserved domain protein [Ruminococcus albus 8]
MGFVTGFCLNFKADCYKHSSYRRYENSAAISSLFQLFEERPRPVI